MAENSKIEWTTHTFNPWRGCTKVSPGCANCYAETLSKRNPKTLGVWGPTGQRVVAAESYWRQPFNWEANAWWCDHCRSSCFELHGRCRGCAEPCRRPIGVERPRVFCASLADVFEDWPGGVANAKGQLLNADNVPATPGDGVRMMTIDDIRVRLFRLIDATPNLDWLLLSKRPENITRIMENMPPQCNPVYGTCKRVAGHDGQHSQQAEPRPNLWLGTSVENQQAADERIPHLLKVPAAVRFLSVEPLLGPLDLRPKAPNAYAILGKFYATGTFDPTGMSPAAERVLNCFPKIDWVIVGGESGPGARPMHPDWARSLRDQCTAAGVPFFFKQWGEWLPISECHDAGTQFYKPNRAAQDGEDQGSLNEIYGTRCVVETRGLQFDGQFGWSGGNPFRVPYQVYKVGKKAAGRLLDCREWNEMPTTRGSDVAVG